MFLLSTVRSISLMWLDFRFLDTEVDGSNPSISMLCPWTRYFIRIASVDSAVKWVPGGDNLERGVQCYELFGGIAHKNHELFFLFQTTWLTLIREAKNRYTEEQHNSRHNSFKEHRNSSQVNSHTVSQHIHSHKSQKNAEFPTLRRRLTTKSRSLDAVFVWWLPCLFWDNCLVKKSIFFANKTIK